MKGDEFDDVRHARHEGANASDTIPRLANHDSSEKSGAAPSQEGRRFVRHSSYERGGQQHPEKDD